MEDMRYLTFALGKGRLANQTLETFEKIGITCEEMKDKKTRKLIFVNEEYKLRFFTNISHEFRTPLTIIRGAIEDLSNQKDLPPAANKQLGLLTKSSNRLLRLIDQ